MAQVLPPFTTQTDPVALLQTGSSDYLNNTMSTSSQRSSRILEMPRSHFNTHGAPAAGYRGTAQAPVSTYAFKTTPQLRTDTRSVSTPVMSGTQTPPIESRTAAARQRYPANPSVSTTSSTSSDPSSISQHHLFNKDDALLFTNFSVPPFSPEADGAADVRIAGQDGFAQHNQSPIKPSPDRYRRPMNRTISDVPSVRTQQSEDSIRTVATATAAQIHSKPQTISVDDNRQASAGQTDKQASIGKQSPTNELPKRYRRRTDHSNEATPSPPHSISVAPAMAGPAPTSFSHKQDARSASPTGYRPSSSGSTTTARPAQSPDAARRMNSPSPLSRPATSQNENRPFSSASSTISHSPAAAAMAAINEKETGGKSMKSRLRRAFSFGSASELNRAGTTQESAAERARARRQQFISELDQEQAAIAQKQEKSGLGRGIYGNRSKMFTGSTDNLSISSTASSASIMLRKMGNNVKKSGRSLKGLFRPKSVVGVPSIDAPMQASVGPVSMVNVEAEREQVNVNINPRDQPGGGTGYPKLERNSIDASTRVGQPLARMDTQTSVSGTPLDGRSTLEEMGQYRSASAPPLKKGILKRSYTASSTGSTAFITGDTGVGQTPLGFAPPNLQRSSSPAPSNASSLRRGLRRPDSSSNDVDDYFRGVPQFSETKSYRSLPGTPQETLRRNISFSPRIQFHDVWSATEYDRRGDVATCNRLTPSLAQQIKEELNTFKMEMEVHELSKVHTHFF